MRNDHEICSNITKRCTTNHRYSNNITRFHDYSYFKFIIIIKFISSADITGIEDRRLSCHGPNIIQVMTMFRKTTMAALVAAVAILGVVAVLQTGGGVDEVDATTPDDIQAAFQNGGSYVLTSNVEINGGTVSSDLVLNLNGYILTTTDVITISSGAELSILDSSNSRGKLYSNTSDNHLINVEADGSLVLNSGTIDLESPSMGNNTINSRGSVVVDGGTITRSGVTDPDGGAYAIRAVSGTIIVDDADVVSEDNGIGVGPYQDADKVSNSTVVTVSNSYIVAVSYGIAVFGVGDMEDNGSVTLTLDNVVVNSDETCISSNASSGDHAGFTIDVNGGAYTGKFGIYAPGYGIYNVDGAHITATVAGIQIAAGVLNINDNTVIKTKGVNDGIYNSLALGGSGTGDIRGAIVVGKHGGGYVGDIDVNINGGTLIAPEGGDAIVILDNSTGIDLLEDYHTSVDAPGGEIVGNIMFTTATGDSSSSNKADDKIDFNLNGASVDGDITRSDDFKGDAVITSGTVTGDVTGDVDAPSSTGSVYYYDLGITTTYYCSFVLPSEPSRSIDGFTFLGYSLSPDSTTIDYLPGATVSGLTGDVTVYEVWENDNPLVPFPDDDDDYVPIPPVVYDDSGDDDTVTIVACAAAAVVAAILAVFLIVERKH